MSGTTYVYRIGRVQVAPGVWLPTKPLKGQRCELVQTGPRGAVLVRFESGELVRTQVRALRKVEGR